MAFLPGFPDRPETGASRTGYGYSARFQDGILISVQGTNSSNAVTYSIAKVTAGSDSITGAKFNELITNISSERVRRSTSAFSYTLTNPISAAAVNSIKNALAIGGNSGGSAYMGNWVGSNSGDGRYFTGNYTPPIYDPVYGNLIGGNEPIYEVLPDPGVVTYPAASAPSVTSDVAVGSLISAATINSIIDSLVAAGAACTCNCNYCTCNCNYACTCNCNYSDERVKTDIEYM